MRRRYLLLGSLTLVLLAAVARASTYAPGGFLHTGSMEFPSGMQLHAVCDVTTLRIVYVAETQNAVDVERSDRPCTVPDDTPNNPPPSPVGPGDGDVKGDERPRLYR